MRRVLLVSQSLHQGGTERQMAATALALDRTRFAPEVAVFRSGGVREAELGQAGIPVHHFALPSLVTHGLPQTFALARFLRRHRFDVVHSFDTPANLVAVPAGRLARTPRVLSSQRAHRALSLSWRRPALRLTDRLSDGVVVNCRYLIDHLVQDEGLPAGKIHLVYNGLDSTHFQPTGPRAPLPFPPDSLVVGVVCVLREEKNLATLLEAFAECSHEPQARLLIVGSGPQLPQLQALAAARGLASRVHFEPAVGDTAPWLRAMDIFVLPSRSEAFSNSLMEAMACGAVPVASRVGGNPELVTPDRGLLFDPAQPAELAAHLRLLLAQPELRRRFSAQAAPWVAQTLTFSALGQAMGALYL